MTLVLTPEIPTDTNSGSNIRVYLRPSSTAPGAQWLRNVVNIRWTLSDSKLRSRTLDRGREFDGLAEEWHRDTDGISSPTKKKNHRAYRKILAMGMAAIPHIIRDLRDRGGDWYEALADISGESPVPPDAQGNVGRMNDAWVNWGRERGYIA